MAANLIFKANWLSFSTYPNTNRISINLVSPINGVICECTVNISVIKLKKNQILIKNYAKNFGILEDLVNAEVVKELSALKSIPGIHLCELLGKYKQVNI